MMPISNSKNKFSINNKIIIENMTFNIIDIQQEMHTISTNYQQYQSHSNNYRTDIKIIAQTNISNYLLLNNWFSSATSGIYHYKKDITFYYYNIKGLFPISYTLNPYNIDVTFSAEYINIDTEKFEKERKRKERKDKLIKLNKNYEYTK